jgi:hypothetical protein
VCPRNSQHFQVRPYAEMREADTMPQIQNFVGYSENNDKKVSAASVSKHSLEEKDNQAHISHSISQHNV